MGWGSRIWAVTQELTLASSADFLKPSKTYATDGKAQIQNKQKIMRMN